MSLQIAIAARYGYGNLRSETFHVSRVGTWHSRAVLCATLLIMGLIICALCELMCQIANWPNASMVTTSEVSGICIIKFPQKDLSSICQ